MLFKKIQRKFHQLSQEPEEVRMRAAIRMSVVLGIIIIPLALLVLLPLQFKLQPIQNQAEPKTENVANEKTILNAPRVGGVSDVSNQVLPIPKPDFPNPDTFQKTLNNNNIQIPRLEPTPSPEIKPLDTNNIPVEIIP